MQPPVIQLQDVHHRFPSVESLRGLTLEVHPGELYGLIGPDGAGKTSAMRLAAGVMAPAAGMVRIRGLDPLDASSGVREFLGYMPQRFSLYGDLSVGENLRYFGDLFCLDRATYVARRDRLLALTRLAPFEDRRADALTGGMYKKLALCVALLHEPAVLLLDEPTNGVDPVSRAELWDLLHEFATHDMAILVTTSYMDEAARCTRVGLLHRGTLIAEGSPSALVETFEDAVLRVEPADTAGASPENLDAVLAALGDCVIAVTPLGSGLRIVVRATSREEAVQALTDAGATVAPARPSFEDLFLSRHAAVDVSQEAP
jgi:ABC-2 type transport system ATP-binding protein